MSNLKVFQDVEDFVEGKKYDVYVKIKITGVYKGKHTDGTLKFDTGMKFIRIGTSRKAEPTIRYVNPEEIATVGVYK